MSEMVRIGPRSGLSNAVHIRSISIDELSHVRYVHSAALKALGAAATSETAVGGLAAIPYSPDNAERLALAVADERLLGAWIDNELVGAACWSPTADGSKSARIDQIAVQPMFAGLGIGRRLLAELEKQSRRSGFTSLTVSAPIPSLGFFARHGFDVTGHGSRSLGGAAHFAVAFMRKSRPSAQRRKLVLH